MRNGFSDFNPPGLQVDTIVMLNRPMHCGVQLALDKRVVARHKAWESNALGYERFSMHNFLVQMFTWWNGATIGTRFHTWRHGTRVGEDEFGNVYYQGGTDSEGRTRRWVIYNGLAEASSIPAGWHGWMHHRTDVSPADMTYTPKDWQKEHLANRTGTPEAYRPPGSQLNPETRPTVTGDYDAWTPGS